eukprot:6463805-Amphidinium_carterae.1
MLSIVIQYIGGSQADPGEWTLAKNCGKGHTSNIGTRALMCWCVLCKKLLLREGFLLHSEFDGQLYWGPRKKSYKVIDSMQNSSTVRSRAAKQLEKGEKNQHLADVKAVNELMRLFPSSVAVMLAAGHRHTRGKQPEVESVGKTRGQSSADGTQDMEAESLAANAGMLAELNKPLDRRSDTLMSQALNSLKAILTYLEPLALSPFNIKGLAGKAGTGQVSKQAIARVIEFLTGVKGKQEFGKCFPTLQALADNLSILNRQRGRLVRHLVVLPPAWPSMGIYRVEVDSKAGSMQVLKILTQEEKTISFATVGFVSDKAIVIEENWSESEAHLRQDGCLRHVSLFAMFPALLTFVTPAKRRKTPAVLDGASSAQIGMEPEHSEHVAAAANQQGERQQQQQHQEQQQSSKTITPEKTIEGDCLMVGVDVPQGLFSSDE